jgi:Family of unknown function (DUF6264)
MSAVSAAASVVSIGSRTMTDDRPLPQYGEYATPEQQAKAMGKHYVAPEPRIEPSNVTASSVQPALQRPATFASGYSNRFLTVFLLGLGALTLFWNVPGYLNYAIVFKAAVVAAGYSSIAVPATFAEIGIVGLVANIVLYLVSVGWSLWWLKRGRVSFYIPILGAVVFVVVMALTIAILAPGYIAQLSQISR